MTWTVFGQYLDIILSAILIVCVFRLNLISKYAACFLFIVYQAAQSIVYLTDVFLFDHGFKVVDYRLIWCSITILAWITTVAMVYSLLIAILKQLPGILRFSLALLNVIFAVSIVIALFTVRPEYSATRLLKPANWLTRLTVSTKVFDRALSLAELLTILCVLAFILRFPIRVPRNLAALSAGLSLFLLLSIGLQLARTYVPGVKSFSGVAGFPGYFLACCLIYWLSTINAAGEKAVVTLGTHWQAVPQEHLVRQLEAMNAALLRSRQQT